MKGCKHDSEPALSDSQILLLFAWSSLACGSSIEPFAPASAGALSSSSDIAIPHRNLAAQDSLTALAAPSQTQAD
jgi:hypothetical protein